MKTFWKKDSVNKYFVVCIVGLLLVLSGCRDLFEPPNFHNLDAGNGTFNLKIVGFSVGRTILPAAFQSDFAAYLLVFSSSGREDVSVEWTNSTIGDSVTLPAGTWNLTVTAYLDSEKTIPIARGSLTGIMISGGANVSQSLELKAIVEVGAEGAFIWEIEFPADVTVAGMTITPLDKETGTPEQTLYFTGGEPLVNKNNSSSPLSLNSGYYQIVFNLSNGSHDTGRVEYLHIYQNMESRFEYTFTRDHFTVHSVTNGEDSGPGSLRYAIANAGSDSTIFVENSVGTVYLKDRLEITQNITIRGNGVTITRDPSWNTENADSQLLIIRNSNTAVTISRVHFKNGRTTGDGAAIYNSSGVNLTLESCIFSGNQTSNFFTYGGAIRNSGTIIIKGCTFYGNSAGYSSGAVYNFYGTLTLEGNLFYRNTGNHHPIVENMSGNVYSNGYNVVDVPLGTENYQSGWNEAATDRTVSTQPVGAATFMPLLGRGALNIIVNLPAGYPGEDFYGTPITNGAAAGAVQTAASGYILDLSVNNSVIGNVSIDPPLDADGLGSTLTLTANSMAGYEFEYWLVEQNNPNIANPLHLTLTNPTEVRAVFGKKLNDEFVKKVTFTDQIATVNFTGLNGNDIYLVKVNTSGLVVNVGNTGGAFASISGVQNTGRSSLPSWEELPRIGHPAADELNANSPLYVHGPRRLRSTFIPPIVGDTRIFWVESSYGNNDWMEKQATLMAIGQYGNIWVMDENLGSGTSANKITNAQAQTLAEKFDLIYPLETNLLGYEYGGGPDGDGGLDGDPKIQILIYDIGGGASGYFWAKDYYPQSLNDLWGYKTNLAEIFYMDTSAVSDSPDFAYSALVHEFQHMIHFNMKRLRHGLSYSATWYNEMLSLMAEDVISPLIGISFGNYGHPRQRLGTFLNSYYNVGITEWNGSSNSYAKGYAFGAYLTRNYGGPELLQRILANNTTDIQSITSALNEFSSGLDFEQALTRFGEAMIFCGQQIPEGVLTFDKTVTSTINGIDYTAYGIDIWNGVIGNIIYRGPVILDLTPMEMRPHSISLHSTNEWKNRSGNFSITLEKPSDSNIIFYLMVK